MTEIKIKTQTHKEKPEVRTIHVYHVHERIIYLKKGKL